MVPLWSRRMGQPVNLNKQRKAEVLCRVLGHDFIINTLVCKRCHIDELVRYYLGFDDLYAQTQK